MAWTDSRAFRAFIQATWLNTAAFDLDSDALTAALYNNAITPDNDVSAANSAYNAGQWATANEVFEAITWPQGGVNLSGVTVDVATADTIFLDAADTASGAGADLASVFGMLLYDNTLAAPVADPGLAYLYFGGSNSVTNGVMTIIYNALGLIRGTL